MKRSVLTLLFLFPALAFAEIPFGGPITYMDPICQGPPFTWIGEYIQLGLPTPYPLMWTPAEISFAYGPPVHPGQYLLGMATPVWLPCILWIWVPCGVTVCPFPIVKGGGFIMAFHGSSL